MSEPIDPSPAESSEEKYLREIRDALAKPQEKVSALLQRAGIYLIPSGVVGGVGKLFGMTDASVAAISLSIFALLWIWHFRYSVEVRIRTWMILALLVILFAGATIFRHKISAIFLERSITKATGIYDYVPHANEALPKIGRLIDSADTNILFSGVNFYLSLPQYRERLLAQMKKGVNVRFLVFDHLSPQLDEVASGFNQSPDELRSECVTTVENLKSLMKAAQDQGATGSLEVRFFRTPPRTRIYVFDRQQHDGTTFFIPHIDHQNSAQLPGFFAYNIPNGVSSEYFAGVDRIWATATRWDDFMLRYGQP